MGYLNYYILNLCHMSLKLNRNASILIKENLDGNYDKILHINCNDCVEVIKDLNGNEKCINCILKNLYFNRKQNFKYISLPANDRLISFEQFSPILEYFKNLKKIKRTSNKVINLISKKCIFKEFKCKVFMNEISLFKTKDELYYNPIQNYNLIQQKLDITKDKPIFDPICQKCVRSLNNYLKILVKILNEKKIINDFKKQNEEFIQFYRILFSGIYLRKNYERNREIEKVITKNLVEEYKIGKGPLFLISIYDVFNETEKVLKIETFFNSNEEEDYYNKLITNTLNRLNIPRYDRIVSLEELIKIYKIEAIRIIESKFPCSEDFKTKASFICALRRLRLIKLFPLLIDDYIEEIFYDSPTDRIYINHQKYGRCRTDISFNSAEIERLKTLLRLYSGKRLDHMNSSIKYVLKNKYFNCRFSIDVGPIQLNNFALDIRKLNKNILTIQDLLKNGTLSPVIAAFLYFNVIRKKNITVTGETDTGKTTFINALDLLTPKEFRKIYIENIIESLNQAEFNKHQLKFNVDSLDDSDQKSSKSQQIKKLLHRTPDIIYLGEILTLNEAEALFHCLAAGLRGFQTIHANTINSLVNRFLFHFRIEKSCLNDLDLIILMKKNSNERRIVTLAEIIFDEDDDKTRYNVIFQYNPESKKWDQPLSLYDTRSIQDLRLYEDISQDQFISFIKIYEEIFIYLSKTQKLRNNNLVDLFHQIAFHSLKSYESIENFWDNWKKNRSL